MSENVQFKLRIKLNKIVSHVSSYIHVLCINTYVCNVLVINELSAIVTHVSQFYFLTKELQNNGNFLITVYRVVGN